MKKKLSANSGGFLKAHKQKIIWIMKRSLIISLIFFFNATAFAFSQKVTLNLGKVTLHEALKKISNEANVDFFYSDGELDVNRVVKVNFKDTEVTDAVAKLVGEGYSVQKEGDGLILIMPVEPSQNIITVKGVVTDENGQLLPGVTVILREERRGVTTNFDGEYTIKVKPDAVLSFSYVGYMTQDIPVNGKTSINVQLQPEVAELDAVVVTGIVERKKESFTGAITTITGEELKTIGNQNLIQSIKTLDPSFIVLENNLQGANPNVLPTIEVRGKTSISTSGLKDEFGGDPNQPLFVLDGFETDLRTIVDLDMNRVASIVILKDASSTALYGAKAANGVVVVETIKPKAGQLNITYTNDMQVETPDLSVYNLMNAEEKLEFERLSGRFQYYSTAPNPQEQFKLDSIYSSILGNVRRGVDTYWLNEPVKTAISQRHSLYVNGGSEEGIQFGAGVNYKEGVGIMKGSGRNTWGSNIDLSYRKGKINISNRLNISGAKADESPYGSFANFAKANPYYKKYNEFGGVNKYLDAAPNVGGLRPEVVRDGDEIFYKVVNPLYDALLADSYNTTKAINIQNTLQAIYSINNEIRLEGGLQLRKGIETRKVFLQPEHSSFDNSNSSERGSYSNNRIDNQTYRGNIMLTYAKVFSNVHQLTANLRGEIEETKNERITTEAIGYPSGTNGNPQFSFGYAPDKKPGTAFSLYRRNNVLASTNYSYDRRYFVDATYRLDGSTAFGSNKKYSPFWSVGLGWNLHNDFKLNRNLFDLLKLRGNIGSTGNQNFGSVASVSIYGFDPRINIFGQGTNLSTLANPDLEWQNTLSTSVGLDVAMFNNRLSASFNAYQKKTDPLVVQIDLPSSTGVVGYPFNTGFLDTKGLEAIVRFSPIYKLNEQIVWTLGLNASALKSTYGGFNKTLDILNEQQKNTSSLERFKDGFSPNDIWAVRSLGIDPATGREVFLKADGQVTFDYDQDDEVVVGKTQPTMEGVISSNLNFKGFTMGVNLRFRYGGDVLNSALYEKVENIDRVEITHNQDRRALYDRWQQPGDIAQFKAISLTGETPISSRFVQQENVLIGESINFGYQFLKDSWIKYAGMKSLRLNAYMNDIFRASSVKVERGIEYPFSRTVSFSLNASF